jgi:hypothetical protein
MQPYSPAFKVVRNCSGEASILFLEIFKHDDDKDNNMFGHLLDYTLLVQNKTELCVDSLLLLYAETFKHILFG